MLPCEFRIIVRWYSIENVWWENLIHRNFKYKCMSYGTLTLSLSPSLLPSFSPSLPPSLLLPLSLSVCVCFCLSVCPSVYLSCRHIYLFRKGLLQCLWKKLISFTAGYLEKFWIFILIPGSKNGPMKYRCISNICSELFSCSLSNQNFSE